MLNIDEMSTKESRELLHKVGYGHLGFIYEEKPNTILMHYHLEDSDIYQGERTKMGGVSIDQN